jgi:hypothetical protein
MFDGKQTDTTRVCQYPKIIKGAELIIPRRETAYIDPVKRIYAITDKGI